MHVCRYPLKHMASGLDKSSEDFQLITIFVKEYFYTERHSIVSCARRSIKHKTEDSSGGAT